MTFMLPQSAERAAEAAYSSRKPPIAPPACVPGEAYMLQAWMRTKLQAGAEAIAWGFASDSNVRAFLGAEAAGMALRARLKVDSVAAYQFAGALLDERIAALWRQHEPTLTEMISEAIRALPRGVHAAAKAAADLARSADAPPSLVANAVDEAVQSLKSARYSGAYRAARARR